VPYWQLHYHLVWATRERAPLITPHVEQVVHQTVFRKARELGLVLHVVGGVSDHVHVVVSIPPTRCVAEIVKQLKGASSRAAHLSASAGSDFRWQEGFAGASLARAIEYVRRQPERHTSKTIVAAYEKVGEPGECGGTQSSSDDLVRLCRRIPFSGDAGTRDARGRVGTLVAVVADASRCAPCATNVPASPWSRNCWNIGEEAIGRQRDLAPAFRHINAATHLVGRGVDYINAISPGHVDTLICRPSRQCRPG